MRHHNPSVPKVAKDASETRPALEEYEQANEKNRIAIETAHKHNRRLQKLYNQKAKKKTETSSWSSDLSWPKFSNPFSSK